MTVQRVATDNLWSPTPLPSCCAFILTWASAPSLFNRSDAQFEALNRYPRSNYTIMLDQTEVLTQVRQTFGGDHSLSNTTLT